MDDLSKLSYQAPGPYPPVQVERPNRNYAYAMLDNIGGSNSEMSAVSLYFYDHLVTSGPYAAVADALHHISIVEMHHLEIFGSLAYQLGADPRLWTWRDNRQMYWTPGFNQYPTGLPQLLRYAISSEKRAIEKYTAQQKAIEEPTVTANLGRIIQDEEQHLVVLDALYRRYVLKQTGTARGR